MDIISSVSPHPERPDYVDVTSDGVTRTFVQMRDGTVRATKDCAYEPGVRPHRVPDATFMAMRRAACQHFNKARSA